MNKEIEIRIQITGDEVQALKNYLGKPTQIEHQTDYYLDNPQSPLFIVFPEGDKDANIFLRIRETEHGAVLCVKDSHKEPGTRNPLYCDEYETSISNVDETLALFRIIGFTEATIVRKTRKIFSLPELEIAIDEVENCGTFMEIEVKKEVAMIEEGYQLIYDWLRSIGITTFIRQKRGYIHLIMNPHWQSLGDLGKEEINLS